VEQMVVLDDLLGAEELRLVNVRDLTVPERISDQWKSIHTTRDGREISYQILQGNPAPPFVMVEGDQFNAILMRSAKPGWDHRIFQFIDFGNPGYVKLYPVGVSAAQTLEPKDLKVGLVYRFEAVSFTAGQNGGYRFFARPTHLVVGDSAAQAEYERMAVHQGDRFYVEVRNFNNRQREPYASYLSFSVFVRDRHHSPCIGEKLLVQADSTNDHMVTVHVIERNITEGIFAHSKKTIMRAGEYDY
jgi:hypothetical protein